MKKIVLVLCLSALTCFVFSQAPLPETTFNLGVGFGQPYGGFGAKALLGQNNSGLLVGVGHFAPGITGFNIGVQVSSNPVYFNVNYGVIRTVSINNGPLEPINGVSIMGGGMIGLGPAKLFFIDLAVGYGFGKKTEIFGQSLRNDGLCLNIGLGYRVPYKKE